MKSNSFSSCFGNFREYPLVTASVFLLFLYSLVCLVTGITLSGLEIAAERMVWSVYFIVFSFVCSFIFLYIWRLQHKQECRRQEKTQPEPAACFSGLLLDFIGHGKDKEKVKTYIKEKATAYSDACGEQPETALYEQLAAILCDSYAEVKNLKEIDAVAFQIELISNTYAVFHYRLHDTTQHVLANKSLLIECRPCKNKRFLFSCIGQGITGCSASRLTRHIQACIRISVDEDNEKAGIG
ncbi:MAG: hypothetical protein LIP00_10500 [Parabacteroides sp.]|nr:hypothetical protein [Parabacteroides sp.]